MMSLLSPLRQVGGTQAVDCGLISLGRPSSKVARAPQIDVLYTDLLIMVSDGVKNIEILPRAAPVSESACVRARFETTPTIAVDLGPGPAFGSAVTFSMYVQVVVEGGVLEIDLPVSERQAPGDDALGNLIEDGESENLTILTRELTENAVVVLGIHPPEEREKDDVLMTALFETRVLKDLAALEGFPAFIKPRPELVEGAASEGQGQDDQQPTHRLR
jgi:hypothetical protein